MDKMLSQTNNILVIGKCTEQQLSLYNNIVNKITSLNNIETTSTFTNEINETDIMTILENQKINPKPVLLYLNDCITSKISSNNCLKQILLNGRHYNIFIVMTIQNPIHFPPAMKANFDLVVDFKETENPIIEKLHLYFELIQAVEECNNLIKKINVYI